MGKLREDLGGLAKGLLEQLGDMSRHIVDEGAVMLCNFEATLTNLEKMELEGTTTWGGSRRAHGRVPRLSQKLCRDPRWHSERNQPSQTRRRTFGRIHRLLGTRAPSRESAKNSPTRGRHLGHKL